MIACRFNHMCSIMVEGDLFRIAGQDNLGRPVDESGRWMQSAGFETPRAAIAIRENVVHIWTDNNVYEFNADGNPLTIQRII